jgi:hypothetical protein
LPAPEPPWLPTGEARFSMSMLGESRIGANVPVSDLDEAIAF